jgi:hypothetical protein
MLRSLILINVCLTSLKVITCLPSIKFVVVMRSKQSERRVLGNRSVNTLAMLQTCELARNSVISVLNKVKVKLSLQQAVEAHRVVRRRGSHIL